MTTLSATANSNDSTVTLASRLPAPLLAAFALHALCLVIAWVVPPAVNSDSATGFLVWESWQRGAPWNHATAVDPTNIARDTTYFQAWWSPGQYLIIAPWQWAGLSLGHAIAVGGFFATALGLWGYWRLFLAFQFSTATAAWSVLAIACNWTLTRTYGDFVGGEPALLCALPWLVLATRRAVDSGWSAWLALPGLYWIGAMAKLSYPPIAAGLIAGLRGSRLGGKPGLSAGKFAEVARWAGWLALGHLLLWATYLRLGANPTLTHGGENHPVWWQALLLLIGFPLASLFSFGSLVSRIFLHPSHPLAAGYLALWPMLAAFSVVSTPLLIWVLRREWDRRRDYGLLLAGILLGYYAFFILVLVLGSATGFEDRYFKPAGFLLAPAIVDAIRCAGRARVSWIVGGALAASCLYGIAAVGNRALYLHRVDNVGRCGITQNVLSREGLQAVHALDDAHPPGSLLVVPSPEIALEIRHVRVLATHAAMSSAADLAAREYRQRVENLFVLVNSTMIARGQAKALLDSFKDYAAGAWKVQSAGEWHLFHQGSMDGATARLP